MSDARSAAQQAARDEYRRLLYVAMTRAKERLVIAAAQGRNKIPDGCWYQLVDDALREQLRQRAGRRRRRRGVALPQRPAGGSREGFIAASARSARRAGLAARQRQLRHPGVRTVTPSSGDDDGGRPSGVGLRAEALLRGSLTHRLLQSLPDIPVERRTQAAEEFLARSAKGFAANICCEKLKKKWMFCSTTPASPNCSPPAAAPRCRSSAGLSSAAETIRVSGQVDRLVVTQGSVLIADFKTDRSVPSRIVAEQSKYAQQLALYRAVLAKLYPEKSVRAALIWTEVPDLMELSAEALDAALTRITSAR